MSIGGGENTEKSTYPGVQRIFMEIGNGNTIQCGLPKTGEKKIQGQDERTKDIWECRRKYDMVLTKKNYYRELWEASLTSNWTDTSHFKKCWSPLRLAYKGQISFVKLLLELMNTIFTVNIVAWCSLLQLLIEK